MFQLHLFHLVKPVVAVPCELSYNCRWQYDGCLLSHDCSSYTTGVYAGVLCSMLNYVEILECKNN